MLTGWLWISEGSWAIVKYIDTSKAKLNDIK